MANKEEYIAWFEDKIVPMLKKHRLLNKCDCMKDETGHSYTCPYHFVKRIILIEIGNHISYLDAENARLRRNTDAQFEPELAKLKDLERQLTLIRDDLSGYGKFMDRNIKQSKTLIAWENSFKELIETLDTLNYVTNTEKEADGLKQKIISIVKGVEPL